MGHGRLVCPELTLCQPVLGTRNLSSVMLLGFMSGLSRRTDSFPALKFLLLYLSWSLGLSPDNLLANHRMLVLRGAQYAAKAGRGLWAGSLSVCCLYWWCSGGLRGKVWPDWYWDFKPRAWLRFYVDFLRCRKLAIWVLASWFLKTLTDMNDLSSQMVKKHFGNSISSFHPLHINKFFMMCKLN